MTFYHIFLVSRFERTELTHSLPFGVIIYLSWEATSPRMGTLTLREPSSFLMAWPSKKMRFSVEESRRKINEKLTQSAASYKTVVVVAEEVAGVHTRILRPTGDRTTGRP